jgi:predicted CoA-binding protein
MGSGQIERILKESSTVAIVGLSARTESDSNRVARYLKEHGYRVIPVNPTVDEVLGEKSYPTVQAIPEAPDVVDVFRAAEHAPAIVEDAIAAGAKAVWLQLGIVNKEAAERARQAGLLVVMDHCMMREHKKLAGNG